ncbi:tRNA lysidine(34) synthetase TilS [Fontisphaera persica]|uniref:tRNA lysidine(34) synthetase TilS n=1 Tax=Fontisphaera persica TaxID=2974023 RepID=UPI0024BFE0EC|nr:tRNA lysidine(34) synthetase TilS [Fontisphaera persica]WCJ61052.1 tRNA lysidine(34) synthetase TilS [Fontisphaera persica]
MNLSHHVENTLLQLARCRPGESLVLAVSGGLDSMVLLHLLARLAPAHRWRLLVAHFNHRLRGRASGADARFVALTAQRLGLPLRVEAAEVQAIAQRERLSLEMAARQARHAFFARAAKHAGAQKILLAHHANDQVELFFVRLLQGTGPTGLKGMEIVSPSPADPSLQLVRPFLEVPRSDLEHYALTHQVRFREDQSNASLAPLRNRIRHKLLPLLTTWQPGLPQVIRRTMELLRAEDCFLTEALAQRQRETGEPPAQWPLALQRRFLTAQLLHLGIAPNFDLIEFLRLHPGQPIMIGEDQRVQADAHLNLQKVPPPPSLNHAGNRLVLQLSAAGQIQWQNREFAWQIRPCREGRRPRTRSGVEWFDADTVGERIVLRHWQPGDRYWPIGAPAEMKLQDFFVNQKVPAAERRRRLLAEAADGRIFWIEGARIAEPFKVRPQTRLLLRWQWRTV